MDNAKDAIEAITEGVKVIKLMISEHKTVSKIDGGELASLSWIRSVCAAIKHDLDQLIMLTLTDEPVALTDGIKPYEPRDEDDEETMLEIARRHNIPALDLSECRPSVEMAQMVPLGVMYRGLVPIMRSRGTVTIATAYEPNAITTRGLKHITGLEVYWAVAPSEQIWQLIAAFDQSVDHNFDDNKG
ncbi:MAG: hypothetical protein ABIA47_03090 [bacterium]